MSENLLIFTFVNRPWLGLVHGKCKKEKVSTYVASKVRQDKTYVLRNANRFSILKISFFSRREVEILSEKLFFSFFALLFTYKLLFESKCQ